MATIGDSGDRDIDTGDLRRRMRAAHAEHRGQRPSLSEVMGRLLESQANDPHGRRRPVANDVDRRRFLQLGGMSLLTSAVLAACTSHSRPSVPTRPVRRPTTTLLGGTADVGLLRLASSMEHYAVGLYGTLAASGLLKTTVISDAAKYFSDQHADHAKANEAFTLGAGGQPFTTVNQAIAGSLKGRVDGLVTEADVVKLAYDFERAAAATYYATIGVFKDPKLNAAVAGIMGVEARHIAILGMILSGLPTPVASVPPRQDSPPYPSGGFLTKDGAIAPGTGV